MNKAGSAARIDVEAYSLLTTPVAAGELIFDSTANRSVITREGPRYPHRVIQTTHTTQETLYVAVRIGSEMAPVQAGKNATTAARPLRGTYPRSSDADGVVEAVDDRYRLLRCRRALGRPLWEPW